MTNTRQLHDNLHDNVHDNVHDNHPLLGKRTFACLKETNLYLISCFPRMCVFLAKGDCRVHCRVHCRVDCHVIVVYLSCRGSWGLFGFVGSFWAVLGLIALSPLPSLGCLSPALHTRFVGRPCRTYTSKRN